MARKNDGLLWHLMDAPWWVSVLFAAIAYIGLSVVLPALAMSSENFIFSAVTQNLPILAPYVAIVLLIPAPVALLKQLGRQRQYSMTTSEIVSQGTTAALNSLSWLEFESYIGEFFKQQGYEVKQAFSQKPDGGVDIWMRKDGQLTLVQCKHWKSRKVGIQILREMYAVMIEHNASKMIVVTSGDFTSEAIKYALDKRLWLINGGELVHMIEQVRNRPTEHAVEVTPPKSATPLCPSCHAPLVMRTAKRGQSKGNQFYGCSSYPRCRYTKNVREV
ncbi:restriction endonuclease [Vibrio cholerae]|uniref:restriction endonuclease n=1 Tax=Vibrio cholerae TaxID=666 RepID=UPI000BA9055D|nr:restriction endonuclease [Vibrio cholerae]EJE4199503.1 restriction endonuclease [Vibrio cholerae]EKF9069086.1 restriction endonuclease [Vibrio cholerae]EKF9802838.1 restriction endonuclease [Vibrio cholerae]EKF9996600.1 restriction endonuclease [Vibrio cholerae]EKG0023096.1 restriction endonuclease [Vibrio cholerae]